MSYTPFQDNRYEEYWPTGTAATIAGLAVGNFGKVLTCINSATSPTGHILDRWTGMILANALCPANAQIFFARQNVGTVQAAYKLDTGAALVVRSQINLDLEVVGADFNLETSGVDALYSTGRFYDETTDSAGALYKMTAGPEYRIYWGSVAGFKGNAITIHQNEDAQTNPYSMTPLHLYGNGCIRVAANRWYVLLNYGDSTAPYFNLYISPEDAKQIIPTWDRLLSNNPDNGAVTNTSSIPFNIVSFEVDWQGIIIALAVARPDSGITSSELRIVRIDINGRLLSNYLIDTIADDTGLRLGCDALAHDGDELACINVRDMIAGRYINRIYIIDIYSGHIMHKFTPVSTSTVVNAGLATYIGGGRFACTYNHNNILVV